ncbi:MAG TPA: hypothetical protein PLO23_04020 [Alphaproteobacteria bacterium]|nr:hypothetical protein [Alphaproteobacteria bacterium]
MSATLEDTFTKVCEILVQGKLPQNAEELRNFEAGLIRFVNDKAAGTGHLYLMAPKPENRAILSTNEQKPHYNQHLKAVFNGLQRVGAISTLLNVGTGMTLLNGQTANGHDFYDFVLVDPKAIVSGKDEAIAHAELFAREEAGLKLD